MSQAGELRASGASLELEGVRQTFGATLAVDDVSLRVEPGEIVCLLGHSGCGKTTLLRVVAGLERPGAGRVLLDGREVAGPSRFTPPEQRGVGMMFQDYALFPHLTIVDNVMFGLSRTPAAKAGAIARAALARVGLARYAEDYPHMLSGGEQQRVALARALAPHPGILLMDEPFSNLDQRMRERIRQETSSLLREKGATALVVTHDPQEAMLLADRIALMRAGRIVQAGTAQELYERPNGLFAARFFCDLNEIPATAENGCVVTPLGTFAAPAGVPDGAVTVCVRPQGIAPQEAQAGARGVMLTRRFLGDYEVAQVAVEGLETAVQMRLAPGRGPAPGEATGLHVDPAHVLVFRRDSV
ncbi:MAG: iron transporter ATP-binding protein [Hyphomicrobiales bacterium]|nr:iron transporter ATP-binding protein [Hyphomicrobiales bacterium]